MSNNFEAQFMPWWQHDDLEVKLTNEEKEIIRLIIRKYGAEANVYRIVKKLLWRERKISDMSTPEGLKNFKCEYPTTEEVSVE